MSASNLSTFYKETIRTSSCEFLPIENSVLIGLSLSRESYLIEAHSPKSFGIDVKAWQSTIAREDSLEQLLIPEGKLLSLLHE